MKVQPSFYSFAAGEIDPELRARLDIEAAKHGAAQMVNLIGQVSGPGNTRGGLRVLEFNSYVENVTGRFVKGMFGTYGRYAFFLHPSGYIYQLNLCGLMGGANCLYDTNLYTEDIDGDNSPGGSNVVAEPEATCIYARNNDNVYALFDWTGLTYTAIRVTLRFAEPAPAETTVTIQEESSPNNWDDVVAYRADGSTYLNIDTTITSTSYDVRVKVAVNSYDPVCLRIVSIRGYYPEDASVRYGINPFTKSILPFLHFVSNPYTHDIIVTSGKFPPLKIAATNEYTISATSISFTSMPSEWVTGNYPSTCAFYQGRSWWSGVNDHGAYIWGSRSGPANYYDMTTGSLATDAIVFVRNKECHIRSLNANKQMLVCTDKDEFLLVSDGDVITPSDVDEVPQSAHGSSKVQGIDLGDAVLYCGADHNKIWEARYQWTDDLWKSRHLNFVGQHLFDNKQIKEMHYARDPSRLIFILFRDGTAVIGKYDTANSIVNWQPFECLRHIETAIVLDRAGVSYLLVLTLGKDDDGTNFYAIEEYTPNILLDHFEEFRASVGSDYSYTELTGNLLSLRDAHGAIGDLMMTSSDWSVTNGSIDQTNYGVISFATVGSVKKVTLSPVSWGSTYKPKYVLVTFLKVYTGAGSHTWEPMKLNLSTSGGAIVTDALEVDDQALTSEILAEIKWGTLNTLTTFDVENAEVSASATFYVTRIAFFDTLDQYKQYRQMYQAFVIDDAYMDQENLYSLPTGVSDASADKILMPIDAATGTIIGCSYTKKLKTLEPRLDMVTGSGKSSKRSGCRVQLGLLDSYVPTINGKPAKVDPEAEVNGDEVINGRVHATITGASDKLQVTIEQVDARRLKVAHVELDMNQSNV